MNFVRLIAILALASVMSFAAAQDYPSKPIRMIIPLTPGSGADIAGRIIAKHLGDAWDEFAKFVRSEIANYQRIVKDASILPQ